MSRWLVKLLLSTKLFYFDPNAPFQCAEALHSYGAVVITESDTINALHAAMAGVETSSELNTLHNVMPEDATNNQVLAQMAIWQTPKKFLLGVHVLPKELDEEVARAHLASLNVKLTTPTPVQYKYLDAPVTGPWKPEHYRY